MDLASREIPDPRLTCLPAMALVDQAAVVASICRVGGTGHKQSHFCGFPSPWDPSTTCFWFSFFLFFARGTGKGTREQSGPSDSPPSSPTDKSHGMLSVPPPSPLFLQASHNPWPATSRSLGGPGGGTLELLFGNQHLLHLAPPPHSPSKMTHGQSRFE